MNKNTELKCKIKTVIEVDYNDLGNFLKEKFGFDKFEFAEIEEMNNYSSQSILVKKDGLYEWDNKDLNKMLVSKQPEKFSTRILLNHLCNLGEIPEGEYMIKISW